MVAFRKLAGIRQSDRVLVVGSTQAPEEETALSAFIRLREEFPDSKLVIVPRHPERFDPVYQMLVSSRLLCVRRSDLASRTCTPNWDVLLVDTVGELRWWWGVAEVAIVGGSFGRRGGQNMLEPAAYGINVGFGPNTSNFKDIVELLLQAQAAERIPALNDMFEWLQQQLRSPQAGKKRGANARRLILEQQGATAATVRLIREYLPNDLRQDRAA